MAEGSANIVINTRGNVTPSSNVNIFHNVIRRIANLVNINFDFQPYNTVASGDKIGEIPEGFRPTTDISVVVLGVSSGFGQIVPNAITIKTNGDVLFYYTTYRGLVDYASVSYECN